MTVALLVVLVLSGGLFVGMPLSMWRATRRAAHERWPPRPAEVVHVSHGAFRAADVRSLTAQGPPAVVRAAALGCWVLGAAFLPGLLAGLVGLLASGLGIVSVPGLVLAWRLFHLGAPLLRGDPDAAERAVDAALIARLLNYVILGLCALAVGALALASRDVSALLALAAATALYACVSLAHARLLLRAADAITAEHARRAELTGVRVEAPDAQEDLAEPPDAREAAAHRAARPS
jgi:hypothetical protein